jgi:hypothetical protein
MTVFSNERLRSLRVGISSYTEDEVVLDVIGNVNISGDGGSNSISLSSDGIATIGDVKITSSGIITSSNPGISTVVYYGDGSNLIGVSAFNVITQDLSSNPVFPTFASTTGVTSVGISSSKFVFIPSSGSVGLGITNPTSRLHVDGDGYFTGVITASTFSGNATSASYASVAGVATYSGNSGIATYATSSGIATYASFSGIATYASTAGVSTYSENSGIATYAISSGIATYATIAGVATALQNSRTFEITGDIIASPISFDGTGNVSLAATIQPNSVALGTDTTGDYVQSITGTSNQITVTGGTGESSTPTLSIPTQFTAPQDVTVTRDLQVNRNLNVNGNITIGGTSATLFTTEFKVYDPDIVLGFRTDGSGNDVSNDTTANHGGIAVASTEGNPLVQLYDVGIGETNPATYKKIMWFKSGAFAGLNTDAWLINYAVGIGSTQFPSGTRLAAGSVQFTERDLSVVRNINASGIVTASNFSGNASSATYASTSGIATYSSTAGISTSVIGGIGSISQLQVTGISTFNNGPILIGIATSTGTTSQRLQVTGGAYVSGNLGIGTTNPTTKLQIQGVLGFGAKNNILIGNNTTGCSITSGTDNFFVGVSAGRCNTIGSYNNFLGYCAGAFNTSGNFNFFGGYFTGFCNSTGLFNNFLGFKSGYYNTTGSWNNFFGTGAGLFNTTGSGNNFFGYSAGSDNITGSCNNFFGYSAGIGNMTGSYNNFFGTEAGYYNFSGNHNNFFGKRAGFYNTGDYNVFLGPYAGYNNQTGSFNIIIGACRTNTPILDGSNQLVIGAGSTDWIVGNSSYNIGIGTTNPTSKLYVVGDVNISGVVTATTFLGSLTGTATTATNLSNAANITTGTINSSRLSGSYNINVSYANTSGISTVSQGLTGTPSISVTNINASGIITASNFSGNASSATYASTAGIATVSQGLTGTPNINVGIVTATEYYGTFKGTLDANVVANTSNYASIAGVSTYATSSGIATYASTAGISTVAQGLTGTPSISVTNINASGISTLGTVRISSGIVTATSGVVTYYGDGSNLTITNPGIGIATESGTVGTGVTTIDFRGSGISTVTVSSGIATINITGGTPDISPVMMGMIF